MADARERLYCTVSVRVLTQASPSASPTMAPRPIVIAALVAAIATPACGQLTEEQVRSYMWPDTPADFATARAALEADPALAAVSREDMERVATWLSRGPTLEPLPGAGVGERVYRLEVQAPGGRVVPTTVLLPPGYSPDRPWPLMFAMHGGPPGSVEGAVRSSMSMLDVWAEPAAAAGWIVASPAMVDVVSHDGRTQDRLPYEIFQPEEARAVIDEVRARFRIDPDRIVSTGISLGSNFSIAYGAAHPDWLSAIVPVSTEGESREWLLRNLATVPTYVLEGTQDQNIRGVGGPRAMDAILKSFGYDLVYREFTDRAHEGFQEHYPEVLEWLAERPRSVDPHEIVRVPHAGIVPTSRRVHWIETDARQALVRARVVSPAEIDVTVRWASEIILFLNDGLVDLDRDIVVRVNGEAVHEGPVRRSVAVALEESRRLGDPRRVYPGRVTVRVPDGAASLARATALSAELEPRHPEGTLSFWEMYAVRAIEERFPRLGFEADEVAVVARTPSVPEQVGLRVRAVDAASPAGVAGLRRDDVIVRFGGEPFFSGRGGSAGLYHWLVRELRTRPAEYEIVVLRAGDTVTLRASYALGPYRSPEEQREPDRR